MDTMMKDHSLVSAADVSGTAVYGADDTKVGSVDRVMIDKKSGKVAYAVMTFGGILGMGGSERPVPWETLSYDPVLGGFRTAITEAQLREAPEAERGWEADRDWETRTHDIYSARPYWF